MAAVETTIPFLAASDRIEFGEVRPSGSTSSDRSKLIIASYNIRYGVGRYLISSGLLRRAGLNLPRRRTKVIAQNIDTAAHAFNDGLLLPPVDILALQEADKQTGRAGGHDVARELATKLDMNWVHVPAGIPHGVLPKARQWWLNFEEQIALYDQGDTGVALLSRLALENVTRIDLPWHECAWRAANGQLAQLEAMLAHAEVTAGPTIILGDFNTLSKRKCVETRHLLESRGYTTPLPTGTATWRGAGLRLHADWIFVRDVKVNRWGVARPLNVSDHWPIWAEIEVG